MPRFHIVAARDGDLVDTIAEWPSEEVAECWAAGVLALEFGLDPDEFDTLKKIAPETDGCKFEELDADPIAEAAIDLLHALEPLISRARFQPMMKVDLPSLSMLSRAANMAQALRSNGYSR